MPSFSNTITCASQNQQPGTDCRDNRPRGKQRENQSDANQKQTVGQNVKSTLLYGSETWKVTQVLSNKLQSFVNKCLRKILKIHWPEKISNKELRSRTGHEHIPPTEIARRKWVWKGHVLRKPGTDTTKQALKWNPQGKRKEGRPAKTWRRSTEEELKKADISHQLERSREDGRKQNSMAKHC